MTKPKSPFNLLLEEVTKTKTTSALSFKGLLRSHNKRAQDRVRINGYVEIYSADTKKILTRAALRNVSPGGLGLESLPVELEPNTKVIIVMTGLSEEFGALKCTVSWIASIDNHPKNYKMIGLSLDNNGPEFRVKFLSFIKSLSAAK